MAAHNPQIYSYDPHLHGSALWASKAHLAARGYGIQGNSLLGYGLPANGNERLFPICYSSARHKLTVAPTRSGKSVAASVPALLTHQGSSVNIDPKGELAIMTAQYRRGVLGHKVHIIDPWNIACPHIGMTPAQFNVLDWLDPDNDDFIEDSLLIASACVMQHSHSEPFWSDEASALIMGLELQVAASPTEADNRNLGRVRDLLNLDSKSFQEFVGGVWRKGKDRPSVLMKPGMLQSSDARIRAAAGRILSKSERELSNIMSTAQQNTHFLESPRIRKSLSRSSFDFLDLMDGKTEIYIVLPGSRLSTYGRFLRLLLTIAITAVSRFENKPQHPVYFLLEEMGALGKLDIVENAYGLMAGYGIQLHGVTQDFNQLFDLYGRRWQTFVANSGVIQCFGTRDLMTAEYISKLCGISTVENISRISTEQRALLLGNPSYLSREDQRHQRALITPDEVMTMHPTTQLLVLANANPVACYKDAYMLNQRYRDRKGQPLFGAHPHFKDQPLARAYDFTNPKIDIGKILARYITIG
jgi:type IV secretion system protein VirD4